MTIDKPGSNQPPSKSPESPAEHYQGPEIFPPDAFPAPGQEPNPQEPLTPTPTGGSPQWFLWFLGFPVFIVILLSGVALGDALKALWERSAVLGMVVGMALVGWILVTIVIAIREWLAMKRLDWLGEIRQRADHALKPPGELDELELARETVRDLLAVYRNREDTRPGSQLVERKLEDIFPGASLIDFAERKVLAELDDRAKQAIRATALRVATETSFMPWPLADVLLVFLSSMQMFRRIAEIYGGRPSVVASWTLSRKVLAQLVVAGALAKGGQWAGRAVGNGLPLLLPISEGATNGVLLVRSGVAAMEVCRPLPFHAYQRPSVISLIKETFAELWEKMASPLPQESLSEVHE